MIDIRERFGKFTRSNYFSRIDNSHILEIHIGLDNYGRESIELRHNSKPYNLKGTDTIEITQYRKEEYNTLRFSLKDTSVKGLFYIFCEDIIENTRNINDISEGYTALANRYHLWKKMFLTTNSKFLSEIEIIGLIGELLYLKDTLANEIGLQEALYSWSGAELTHKDFSYYETWTEVKSIVKNKQSVRISSLEQLESKKDGILAVYSFEKMSENYNGITLNSLVKAIFDMFDNIHDKEKFISKLSVGGYIIHDYYDSFVYELNNFKRYKVENGFPRLTHADLPEAITKVSYEISLDKLAEFEIL